jgi:hypothetical protein
MYNCPRADKSSSARRKAVLVGKKAHCAGNSALRNRERAQRPSSPPSPADRARPCTAQSAGSVVVLSLPCARMGRASTCARTSWRKAPPEYVTAYRSAAGRSSGPALAPRVRVRAPLVGARAMGPAGSAATTAGRRSIVRRAPARARDLPPEWCSPPWRCIGAVLQANGPWTLNPAQTAPPCLELVCGTERGPVEGHGRAQQRGSGRGARNASLQAWATSRCLTRPEDVGQRQRAQGRHAVAGVARSVGRESPQEAIVREQVAKLRAPALGRRYQLAQRKRAGGASHGRSAGEWPPLRAIRANAASHVAHTVTHRRSAASPLCRTHARLPLTGFLGQARL